MMGQPPTRTPTQPPPGVPEAQRRSADLNDVYIPYAHIYGYQSQPVPPIPFPVKGPPELGQKGNGSFVGSTGGTGRRFPVPEERPGGNMYNRYDELKQGAFVFTVLSHCPFAARDHALQNFNALVANDSQ